MKSCRACLSENCNLQDVNAEILDKYNLLTGLYIMLDDDLPQKLCQLCWDTVDDFIKFRNRCIASEASLHEQKYVKKEKQGTDDDSEMQDTVLYENPIKVEVELDDNMEYRSDFDDASSSLKVEVRVEGATIKDEIIDTIKEVKLPLNQSLKDMLEAPSTTPRAEVINLETDVVKVQAKRKKNLLLCGLCDSAFVTKEDLHTHIETHRSASTCQLCGEAFEEWPQLISHRLNHITNSKQLKCHLCWKLFKLDHALEYHFLTEHYDKEFPGLKCKYCGKVYQNTRQMGKHINDLHKSKAYTCEVCSRVFTRKHALIEHMNVHSAAEHACDQCSYTTKHKTALVTHKLRRHAPEKFICQNCRRVFAAQAQLDAHACADKPWMCNQCGKVFSFKAAMMTHAQTHSSERPFKCTRCPASYRTAANLRTHTDKHDEYRRYKCEYCTASFYSYNVLVRHRRTHTGEKPYVCKICEKGFSGSHNLKVHMKVHGEMLITKKTEVVDFSML
ncbi:zinc finger protein 883 [Plutella xylostella]|uniref:zinc finger protein 883 n=1 Tax=Plutella xylostella TaxID=51655 RepID=UPI0020323823|nr:zinc finger protein 883 [Plutella xylostella]